MKEIIKKNKKTLVVILILLLVLVIASTYAWLRLTKSSNTINKITAGNLELVLDDTTSEGIKLVNEVPRSYRQGMETKEYTFTLTNKNSTSSYKLSLADLEKYTDEDGKETVIAAENRINDSKIRYILLKDGEVATADKSKILTDRIIDTGTIKKGQTISYTLRVWIDSHAETDIMGKIFNAQLSLIAEQTSSVTPTSNKLCKRATTLHTEECNLSYCENDGYASWGTLGTTITYGSLGTQGVLTSGDAFDCDVNGDGVYDSETERFYYVSTMTNGITTYANTAVLIYYNNVSGGVPSNSTSYAYYPTEINNNGPAAAIEQLPTTSQWNNVTLTNTKRTITSINDKTETAAGSLPQAFSYDGYSARLLTVQELSDGCKITVGSYASAELSTNCQYLFENTKYSSSDLKTYGAWLESPWPSSSYHAWSFYSDRRYANNCNVSDNSILGVRPVIEVAKTNIEY